MSLIIVNDSIVFSSLRGIVIGFLFLFYRKLKNVEGCWIGFEFEKVKAFRSIFNFKGFEISKLLISLRKLK